MLRSPARAAFAPYAFAALAAIATCGTLAACSYDWNVPSSSDAAAPDAAFTDAAPADATAVDAATADAVADAPVTGKDATGDRNPPDCLGLFRHVDDTRAAAKKCISSPTACTTHIVDQCNCITVVGQSGTAEDSAYISAVADLKSSGCPLACPSSCPVARDGLCVIFNGGPATACNQ